MLSKLIKHELRASRRIMLPFLGAVLALSVLAGISTTAMEHQVDYSWLNVVYGLIIFAFVMGVMAVCVVAVVMMIQRFYKNLLGDEGYVSFTLPATVDEHIFAKLHFIIYLVLCHRCRGRVLDLHHDRHEPERRLHRRGRRQH